MLISALNTYYNFLAKAGEVLRPGTLTQKITHIIALRLDGTISSIMYVPDLINIDQKPAFPYHRSSSGIGSYILDYRPLYIFGLNYDLATDLFTPDDSTNKARKSHASFVETNLAYTEGMTSDIVTAYRNFLKSWVPENETENAALMHIAKDYSKASFAFCLDGHPGIQLHHIDGEVMQKVLQNVGSVSEDVDGVCAVTGQAAEIADTHDIIQGIRGANSAGCRIVCFKESAFESYKKEKSYNCPISKEVMHHYTEALNFLINDPRHHVYLDDLTVVFWAMSENDDKETAAIMDMFGFGNEKINVKGTNELVENALKALSDGKEIDLSIDNIDKNVMFYMVGFAGNGGRIAQKFIYRNKYGEIFKNTAQHQLDMRIEGGRSQISIWRMLFELKSPKSKTEKVPPPLIDAIFKAILYGTRYPDTLLETVVRRIKVEDDIDDEKDKKKQKNKSAKSSNKKSHYAINYVRVGIIKACINRNLRLNKKEEEIKMSLDKTSTNEAYLCGRLFAVLEQIQRNALGKLNRTIKDSYFASACSTPALVFPKLMSLTQTHLKKDKYAEKNNDLVGEIINMLGIEFPSTLSLQDQGRFIIGYYQQRQNLFKNEPQDDTDND